MMNVNQLRSAKQHGGGNTPVQYCTVTHCHSPAGTDVKMWCEGLCVLHHAASWCSQCMDGTEMVFCLNFFCFSVCFYEHYYQKGLMITPTVLHCLQWPSLMSSSLFCCFHLFGHHPWLGIMRRPEGVDHFKQ